MALGAITALMEISKVKPDFIFKHLDEIKKVAETGSDLDVDRSILALAHTAAADAEYSKSIFPYMLQHLLSCHHKHVPERAEKILVAVNEDNKIDFVRTLKKRLEALSGSDFTRLKKIIRLAENI